MSASALRRAVDKDPPCFALIDLVHLDRAVLHIVLDDSFVLE